MMMKLYGIKDPRQISKEEILIQGQKLQIPASSSYGLKTTYFQLLRKKDSSAAPYGLNISSSKTCSSMNNYMQPLQLMYFDEQGTLTSFHINCTAPGFPKLKWNYKGQFKQFIPLSSVQPIDSVITLELVSRYLQPLSEVHSDFDHNTIFLFWSNFMFKQSKELIRVARKNLVLDQSGMAKIVYVNVDNSFAETSNSKQIQNK